MTIKKAGQTAEGEWHGRIILRARLGLGVDQSHIRSVLRPGRAVSALASDTLVGCGDTGWGDEIAFGVKVTISLAIATLPVGLALGFLIALARQSNEWSLRAATGVYTTIFRGMPELLTLFIIYYGFQILLQALFTAAGTGVTIEINAFVAGMLALSVVFSSYASEVLLSAFQAIPRGQYEAGSAVGLSKRKTMWLVIVRNSSASPSRASAISGWYSSRIQPRLRRRACRHRPPDRCRGPGDEGSLPLLRHCLPALSHSGHHILDRFERHRPLGQPCGRCR